MFCCVRRFRSYEELKLLKVCCCSGRRDACSADASSVVRCMLGAAERRGNLFVCLSNADAIPDRSLIIWPLVSDYSALRVSLSGGHHGPPGGPAPTPPPHHPHHHQLLAENEPLQLEPWKIWLELISSPSNLFQRLDLPSAVGIR